MEIGEILSVTSASDPNIILHNLQQDPLIFQQEDPIKISIIVPVRNKFEYTYRCLKSIHDHTNRSDYEIIVVDDSSSDRTQEMLAKIQGIRVLTNETNDGFVKACNKGARQARGEYLVFLNNDTAVRPNWLDWLLWTLETVPVAGLVGAKLIYPDGRLQEGGGIIWRDGSGYNCGRLGDPGRPEWNYLREVDYCSGTCLMIPGKLFINLGLFDERYAPAYYEDADLAFSVRASGKKVLYQPLAVVIHWEGVTAGRDTSKGVKRFQLTNQSKFYDRWKNDLQNHQKQGTDIELAMERNIKSRILIIDAFLCLPDQDAGSLRMFNLMRILQTLGCKVTFYPSDRNYLQPYLNNMRAYGIEILIDFYINAIEKYLADRGKLFDVVMISRVSTANRYIDLVRKTCPKARIIFDTVDLHFLREGREAELRNDAALTRAAEQTKALELSMAAKADATIVVSQEEKGIIEAERPGVMVRVISTIHEIYGCKKPFRDREGLLFIGGFNHTPNVDAVVFLVREILPLLRGRIDGLKTFIIGSNPPEEITSLASDGVIVAGYVPVVEPYFNRCRLSIAPLRWGAGVKGKINLSMSYGLPVVATPIAVEGMSLTEGEDVLTASGAEEFAAAVTRLYHDELLWNKLSANGIENVRRHFSFETAKKAVASILDEIGAMHRLT